VLISTGSSPGCSAVLRSVPDLLPPLPAFAVVLPSACVAVHLFSLRSFLLQVTAFWLRLPLFCLVPIFAGCCCWVLRLLFYRLRCCVLRVTVACVTALHHVCWVPLLGAVCDFVTWSVFGA